MPLPQVLMVNYEYPPLGGGSGNAMWHVLRELRGMGLRVDVITAGPAGCPAEESVGEAIRIFRVPVRKRDLHYWSGREIAAWTARALRDARRLMRESRYDLCHCWSGWPSGVIGYLLRSKLPYLVALRGSDVPGYNVRLQRIDPLLRPLVRRIWRSASALTSVSDSLAGLARRTDPEIAPTVIRNGVDSDAFRPGRPSARFTVVFAGRLIERKGVDDLIRGFASAARDDGIRLVIAGDGPERNRLQRLSRECGIADRVEYRGAVSHDDLSLLYRQARVFVIPASEEAMSNAALEAMASGLAIVTTPTGVAEIVRGSGIVVERRNPAQIARAIERYRTDEALCQRHGHAARRTAETMTWASVARDYALVYEQIAASGPTFARSSEPRSLAGAQGRVHR